MENLADRLLLVADRAHKFVGAFLVLYHLECLAAKAIHHNVVGHSSRKIEFL
jgi:hypothetical protein